MNPHELIIFFFSISYNSSCWRVVTKIVKTVVVVDLFIKNHLAIHLKKEKKQLAIFCCIFLSFFIEML